MCADFNREECSTVFIGELTQLLRIIGYRFFAKDASILVSHAHVVFLIAEVDADYRSELFLVRIFFRSFHKQTRSQAAGAASNLLIPSTFYKMKIYFTYSQTPELLSLGSKDQRDSIHTTCWKNLRSSHPSLWVASFGLIAVLAALGALVGQLISPFLETWSVKSIFVTCAGIGAGIGALLHTHMMAVRLRPLYRSELARLKKSVEQGSLP